MNCFYLSGKTIGPITSFNNQNGTHVCFFTMMSEERVGSPEKNWIETSYFRIKVFGNQAKSLYHQYVQDSELFVKGKIQTILKTVSLEVDEKMCDATVIAQSFTFSSNNTKLSPNGQASMFNGETT